MHLRQPRVQTRPRLQELAAAPRDASSVGKKSSAREAIGVLLDQRRALRQPPARPMIDRRLERVEPASAALARRASGSTKRMPSLDRTRLTPTGIGAVLRRPLERSARRRARGGSSRPSAARRAAAAERPHSPAAAPPSPAARGRARSGCASPRDARSSGRAAGSPRRRPGAPGRPAPDRGAPGSVSRAIVRTASRSRSAPGASFDVRLELVEGVVEPRVPLVDQLLERLEDDACVSGRWNAPMNRSSSARSPTTGRASSRASRNSGLSVSSRAKSASSRT